MLDTKPSSDNAFKLLRIGAKAFIVWNLGGDKNENGHCVPVENIIDIDFDFDESGGSDKVYARIVWEGPDLDDNDHEESEYLTADFEGRQACDLRDFLLKFEVDLDEYKDTK